MTMRYASAFLTMTLLLASAAAASAQAKPDFGGTWTVDAEKTAAANPGMPAGGPGGRGMGMAAMGPMTLTLDGATLTRESEGRDGPMKTVYTLDGAERTVSMGMGEARVKAAWAGETLSIVTTRQGRNGVMTTEAIYAREGDWLVVTSTLPGREGGPVTRKVYYKKG